VARRKADRKQPDRRKQQECETKHHRQRAGSHLTPSLRAAAEAVLNVGKLHRFISADGPQNDNLNLPPAIFLQPHPQEAGGLLNPFFVSEMPELKAHWRTLLFRSFRPITNEEFHVNHRHLILAYLVTWLLQLGYLGTVLVGWRRLRG